MATIKIQNIGAISFVEMKLNKVNVIMGPQSSGKSTIAKLISYCQWVEKRRLLDGKYNEDVNKQLLRFHHLDENYFNENSYFEYESDFIKITYSGKELRQMLIVGGDVVLDYKKTKNIYIPAERNFVSIIPNLGKYNETNDNIMNLIYDWFTAKKGINKQKSLPLLNFGINYYYQEGADRDMLILKKLNKEIPLNTGSSGLQSITPLLVILEYLIKTIYNDKPSISVIENEYTRSLHNILINGNKDSLKILQNRINKLVDNRNFYNSTQFIIEEPEQNLFPSTQRDLIYYILEKLQSEREHTLTITTHSPYILYALNNCMLGGLVNSQMVGKEREEFLNNSFTSSKSWINPNNVTVWEIEDGKLRIIQDQDNIISKNYFDEKMTELMNEYDQILNYYADEE